MKSQEEVKKEPSEKLQEKPKQLQQAKKLQEVSYGEFQQVRADLVNVNSPSPARFSSSVVQPSSIAKQQEIKWTSLIGLSLIYLIIGLLATFSSIHLPVLILASVTVVAGAWAGSKGNPGPGIVASEYVGIAISMLIQLCIAVFNLLAAVAFFIYVVILLVFLLLIVAGMLGLIGLVVLGVGILLGVQKEANVIGQFLVSLIYILWDRARGLTAFVVQLIAGIIEWSGANIGLAVGLLFWTTSFTVAICCFLGLAEGVSRLGARSRNSRNHKHLFLVLWGLPELCLLFGFFVRELHYFISN